jgi:hypothetical protein
MWQLRGKAEDKSAGKKSGSKKRRAFREHSKASLHPPFSDGRKRSDLFSVFPYDCQIE